MAKQAREKRRQAQRSRRAAGSAADVADRAKRGVAELVEGIKRSAALRGLRVKQVDWEGFGSVRESFIQQGYRWPSWCFLPVPLLGAALGEEIAIDLNPALVSPATALAALAGSWAPGRIAVRFDDDLAAALMDTPLEGTIPTDVLHRLPAWGLYVDWPALGSGAGFFVCLDAGTLTVPGGDAYAEVDELLVAIVRSGDQGPPVVMSSLWLRPEATIADALAEQARQTERFGTNFLGVRGDEWAAKVGLTRAEVHTRVLSLLLYLCSDDADLVRREVPSAHPSPRARAGGQTTVMSAGFRLGAALRTAAGSRAAAGDEAAGHKVAPHLRRAHWHHYWVGSELRGDRRLTLRWLSPVIVNAELSDEMLTVVRPVGHS